MEMQKDFESLLQILEEKTGKLYTLSLHEVGTPNDKDIVFGKLSERTCKWKIVMNRQRKKFGLSSDMVDMDEDLMLLNGVYNSYDEMNLAITRLRLDNAVELYRLGKGGSLASYKEIPTPEGKIMWELTCGACGKTMKKSEYIRNMCQTRDCYRRNAIPTAPGAISCNNFEYLVPPTILDGVHAGDGEIYHRGPGSIAIITTLGKIVKC
uniref:Uncharacterized protein n=1 Tax=viral metagenome TaxID=1070528 RepID=A0A6C0EL09_9ZZZZ